MEVDNAILSLACLARVYHGASVEDAGMLARKAIEIAGVDADEVDLIDALDDVWAASMVAGTFTPTPFDLVYPISPKQELILAAVTEEEKNAAKQVIEEEEHVIPKRYKNVNLIARKKKRNKNRRRWDKN